VFHPKGPALTELLRQALSSTQQGYDLLAPKFDYTPFRTPEAILQTVAEQLGDPGSVQAALDLCCGTGAAASAIRPLCHERVVGLDFSQGMLEVARQRSQGDTRGAALEWVRGDALQLPFRDVFDLVVCFGAHGHILPRDEAQFVRQIAGALVPGGRFVFATTTLPSMRSPQYWIARGFNAAMRVRNLFVRPPFVMYYLTFLLPHVQALLEAGGFEVEVREDVFKPPFNPLALVIATRRQSR
jgi:ubiquinone/menaquinone biosynthesis C-methylase UbiE